MNFVEQVATDEMESGRVKGLREECLPSRGEIVVAYDVVTFDK